MNLPPALQGHVLGLHHVAIAVPSIALARPFYVDVMGLSVAELEHVPDQKVNVLVVYAGTQRIELVEPASNDSPISSFLQKRGSGLHHVAFEVADVAAVLEQLAGAGLRLIDRHPRPGAHGTRIAFVHPSATGGVLTELVQTPVPNRSHA